MDEWLPADHLARFIADLVDEHLDLSGDMPPVRSKKQAEAVIDALLGKKRTI